MDVKDPTSKSKAKIWLIVPMYNASEYLTSCLESIKGQTFPDFHVLLIDDGSSDSTVSIAKRFAETDQRFEVIEAEHRGVSGCRNLGIDLCNSEYIGFVDADDCLYPHSLKRLYDNLVRNNADVCIGEFQRGETYAAIPPTNRSELVLSYTEAMKHALYQDIIMNAPWGMLMRRSLLGENKRFREGIRYEDLDAFYRFYEGANKIVYLPEKVYFYRQHPVSFMHQWSEARKDALDVTDRIVEFMQQKYPELKRAAEDRRFSAHYNLLLLLYANNISSPETERRCWQVIRNHRSSSLFDPNVRLKNKLGAIISFLGKRPIKLISKFQK